MQQKEYHGKELADRLMRNVKGLEECVNEYRFGSAYPELNVAEKILRASRHNSPEELTDEKIELLARLAWAEADIIYGSGVGARDDLEGVEELAEAVYNQ